MRNAVRALHTYLSGFGLPTYAEDSVPDGTQLPYITYRVVDPEWHQKASFFVRVWYRTNSNSRVLEKADEIIGDIGEAKRLPFEGGLLVVWPESPKVQIQVDGNDRDLRYAYINLSLNSYHMPGV